MLPCSKYNRPGSPLCGKIFMTRPVVRRWIAEAHPARTGQACGGGGAPGSSARDTRSRELYGNCGNWENCVITHCFNKIIPPPPLFFPLPNSPPPSFRLLLHIRLILLLLLPASSPPSVSSPLHPSSPPSYIFLFLFFFSIISSPHLSVCPSVGWLVGCWPVCHNFLSVIISLTDRREVSLLHMLLSELLFTRLSNSEPSPLYQCSTGCSLNIVFFPRILESLPPLPRQPSAAIGCTKNYQPIGVTVHSLCDESFEGLLQPCRRGRVAVNCEKTQFFLNTL